MSAAPLNDQQTRVLLGEALTHVANRSFVSAERILDVVLTARPDDASALHVYGQMRRVQNRMAEAEGFFRRAVAAEPERAEYRFHLGQVLQLDGQVDEAIAMLQEAIRLRPDLAEAHFELGMAYSRKFELGSAEAAYREAARLQPSFLAAYHAWSATLIGLGRPREAEAVARAALPRAAADMRWFAGFKHNIALALSEQHRYDDAVAAYDDVLGFAPSLPLAEHNRANALSALGRNADAEAGYRRALKRDPLDFMAHRGLSQLLWRRGRPDLFESYDEAAKLHPRHPGLLVEKGRLQLLYEMPAAAQVSFARALEVAPEDERAREGHATALSRTGDHGKAIAEFESVLVRRPASVEVRCGLAECLLRAGEPARALVIAEEARNLAPHNQMTLALRNTAMRALPDHAEQALGDYDRFIATFDLGAPEGFSDLGTFHDVIATLLEKLHGEAPPEGADKVHLVSRTGGSLLGGGSEVLTRFGQHLDRAVASYVKQLPADEAHPFLGRRQGALRYSRSWSTRVLKGGAIPNHIHDGAWISAIYYVKLPDDVSDRTNGRAWTSFGAPPFEANLVGPVSRLVRPVPGRLVLFPSYLWHGSTEFRNDQPRLSIAFDLVPEQGRRVEPGAGISLSADARQPETIH